MDAEELLKQVTLTKVEVDGRELGRGAYAKVFTVKYDGHVYAAKEIHSILVEEVGEEQKQAIKKSFLRECYQCSVLEHPNIVQFMGICYLDRNSYLPVIVMELMDQSLTSFLRDKPNVEIKAKHSILLDISHGLAYLHTRDPPIIHRDLSPNNVMLTDKLVAKIGDLGVAKMIQADKNTSRRSTLTTAPGTADFMPPESLIDKPVYDTSLDIFSFGGVTLFVINEEWPTPTAIAEFDPRTRCVRGFTETERRQRHIDMMVGEADELRSLVQRCLDNDPAVRPNINILSESLKIIAVNPRKRLSCGMKLSRSLPDVLSPTLPYRPNYENIKRIPQDHSHYPMPRIPPHSPSDVHSLVLFRREISMPNTHVKQDSVPLAQPSLLALKSGQCHIKWTKCADLPHKMHGASVVVDKRIIYVTDTNSPHNNPRNDVYCYNMGSNRWKELPRPKQHYFVLLMIDGQLNAIGGEDSVTCSLCNKVSTFSETEKSWVTYYPNLLCARFKPGAVVHCDHVIVAGGQTSDGIADDIEILNWTQLPLEWKRLKIRLPCPMFAMQFVVCEDQLYIAGYMDSSATHKSVYQVQASILASSLNQSLQIDNYPWTKRPATPVARVGMASIYPPMIAGGSLKGNLTSDVFVLDIHNRLWKKVASLTSPRANVAIATISNTTIMVIGGYSKGGSVEAAAESSLTTVELGEAEYN